MTYSASGLPTGLAIDATSGKITGTIDKEASKGGQSTGSNGLLDGKYTVTVTADDKQGGTATQTFTIDSTNQAPIVGTKTADQTSNDGQTIATVKASDAFSDPNGDALTYTASNLPKGLAISTDGLITGTVAGNATPGTYSVTVTAMDDKGAATSETFNWVVKDVPPTDKGTLANQTYMDGQAGISISTSQGFNNPNSLPLTYSASGLPTGLAIDATSGKITGTIDKEASKGGQSTGSNGLLDGKYTVTVTADDKQGGTATQTFTIDSTNQAPIVGTKTADQSSNDGQTIATVKASDAFSDPNGDTLIYTASNLPKGLAISTNGLITGTVAGNAAPGTYSVTVTAMDDKGAATSETFNWVVKDVPPTDKGTLANQNYTDGQAGISISTSQGFNNPNSLPLTYSASGLPTGLAIDATSGKITGTIDKEASKGGQSTGSNGLLDGKYTVTVIRPATASAAPRRRRSRSTRPTFTIDSTNQAPIVGTKITDRSNNDGDTVSSVNTATSFSDPNGDPLTYSASNLPAGLTISADGVISGTIAKNAQPGTYAVMVTATDDKGAAATETFNWVVNDVPPTASGTLHDQMTTDGQKGVSISTSQGFNNPNGNALTYSATGLPMGLTIDPKTGRDHRHGGSRRLEGRADHERLRRDALWHLYGNGDRG